MYGIIVCRSVGDTEIIRCKTDKKFDRDKVLSFQSSLKANARNICLVWSPVSRLETLKYTKNIAC